MDVTKIQNLLNAYSEIEESISEVQSINEITKISISYEYTVADEDGTNEASLFVTPEIFSKLVKDSIKSSVTRLEEIKKEIAAETGSSASPTRKRTRRRMSEEVTKTSMELDSDTGLQEVVEAVEAPAATAKKEVKKLVMPSSLAVLVINGYPGDVKNDILAYLRGTVQEESKETQDLSLAAYSKSIDNPSKLLEQCKDKLGVHAITDVPLSVVASWKKALGEANVISAIVLTNVVPDGFNTIDYVAKMHDVKNPDYDEKINVPVDLAAGDATDYFASDVAVKLYQILTVQQNG